MKVVSSIYKPFHLVEKEDGKVIIVAGNTQASPLEFKNFEDAETYLREQPYEMFTNLYSIFRYYETKKQDEKSTKDNK